MSKMYDFSKFAKDADQFGGGQDAKIANYNGRKYKVLFVGPTKFGQRAHLSFFDGTKDFWVDAGKCSITDSPSISEQIYGKGRHGPVVKCKECGGWKAPGDPCGEPCD